MLSDLNPTSHLQNWEAENMELLWALNKMVAWQVCHANFISAHPPWLWMLAGRLWAWEIWPLFIPPAVSGPWFVLSHSKHHVLLGVYLLCFLCFYFTLLFSSFLPFYHFFLLISNAHLTIHSKVRIMLAWHLIVKHPAHSTEKTCYR